MRVPGCGNGASIIEPYHSGDESNVKAGLVDVVIDDALLGPVGVVFEGGVGVSPEVDDSVDVFRLELGGHGSSWLATLIVAQQWVAV